MVLLQAIGSWVGYTQVLGIPPGWVDVYLPCNGLFWIGVQGSLGTDHGMLSAPGIRGQTRQTIVVVVEEWSKLRHVSHLTLSNTNVKEEV